MVQESGRPIRRVAADLGIHHEALRLWVRSLGDLRPGEARARSVATSCSRVVAPNASRRSVAEHWFQLDAVALFVMCTARSGSHC
jgi:transposase-like protein